MEVKQILKRTKSQDKRLIRRIYAKNILSFAEPAFDLELLPLNVFIGTNGSGKSNIIELISILRSSRTSISAYIRENGGIDEYIFQGSKQKSRSFIGCEVLETDGRGPIGHYIQIKSEQAKFSIANELVIRPHVAEEDLKSVAFPDEKFHSAQKLSERRREQGMKVYSSTEGRWFSPRVYEANESVVEQRNDPDRYPEMAYLNDVYDDIAIYREWTFGRNTIYRAPQRTDSRDDKLEEDFNNFAIFLQKFKRNVKIKRKIIEYLGLLNQGFDDFNVIIEGGTGQVFLTEGDFSISARRLSDGTLRFLALLAILLDPSPPRLICIEEPEIGLHPDIISVVAELMVEASTRTQVIVTTHSDLLVSALSEAPDCIFAVEKDDSNTEVKLIQRKELETFTESYRLGELWLSGELGATRW